MEPAGNALPNSTFHKDATTMNPDISATSLQPATGIPTPATSDSDSPVRSREYTKRRESQRPLTLATSSESDDIEESDDKQEDVWRARKRRKVCREISHVAMTGPAYPRSRYLSWRPPIPAVAEADALVSLLPGGGPTSDEDFTYLELSDFSIYLPRHSAHHSLELVSLDRLSQDRFSEFCFDGCLSLGEKKHYVTNVPFRVLTVDGYGERNATDLGRQLCIQTPLAARADVWYRLGSPSAVYRRFHDPFIWLARFTKHFVDYLLMHSGRPVITLQHFRKKFHTWLHSEYEDTTFYTWLEIARLEDFRTTVAAHVNFLYKECHSIDDRASGLCRHPIWGEIGPNLTAIPEQPNREAYTVVTPYAFDCFRAMYFGEKLVDRRVTNHALLNSIDRRKASLGLTPFRQMSNPGAHQIAAPVLTKALDVKAGDVVCVRPHASTMGWKITSNRWFVYVQRVRRLDKQTLLDVLWMYEPKDTTIGMAYYPFSNELFLSDNCECGKFALDLDCVIAKTHVNWFVTDPRAQRGFFVRQKFRTIHDEDTYDFVSLTQPDFSCHCSEQITMFDECQKKYNVGDTVLVRQWSNSIGEDRLQPAIIKSFDIARRQVCLLDLQRKSEMSLDSKAKPNELHLSTETYWKPPDRIIRRCHVRTIPRPLVDSGSVPTPYDRDGAGDFFYIAFDNNAPEKLSNSARDAEGASCSNNQNDLPSFRKGWDPLAAPDKEKLVGMGIFCGGGTFDRGLAEGGGIDFRYAIDWATPALHSYRANEKRPGSVRFFLGSVNDYLGRAMAGEQNNAIARPGNINFISAGSPCPGFSSLQLNKLSEESKQNASMVASVVSFVDFYCPEYLMLENVVTMTNGLGPNKDQNVFSQIIASLVGLGYQVQQFLMDSWSYGSSQQRSRVFIVASAPGLKPLDAPAYSHSLPSDLQKQRALGRSSNGKPFGKRRNEYTTFTHVSPRHATSDLPYLGDAQSQICPAFPDHRTAPEHSEPHRVRMAMVPTRPHGMGLMQAAALKRPGLPDLLSGEPLDFILRCGDIRRREGSQMYARVRPDFLFPTIVTRLAVSVGVNGRVVHWDQHRILTVMETKRAQGYLDEEVLIGKPVDQVKIIGNSVDRKVALVLGLALRESWMGSDQHIDESEPHTGASEDSMQEEGGDGATLLLPGSPQSRIRSRPDIEPDELIDEELDDEDALAFRYRATESLSVAASEIEDDELHASNTENGRNDKIYDDSVPIQGLKSLSMAGPAHHHGEPASYSGRDDVHEEEKDDHDDDDDYQDELAQHNPATPSPPASSDIDCPDSLTMDNRTAKIALHLSPSEIEEVRRDHFKAIRRILDARRGY